MKVTNLTPLAVVVLGFLLPDSGLGCDLPAAKNKVDEAIKAQKHPRTMYDVSKEAVNLCDTYAPAHNAFGTALEKLGEFADAERAYRRARELDPDFCWPLLGLGDIARIHGDSTSADRCFVKALELAKTEEEKEEAEKSIRDIRRPRPVKGGYRPKSVDELIDILRPGQPAPRPKSPGTMIDDEEYGAGPEGYEVNLTILFKYDSAELLEDGKGEIDTWQVDQIGKALTKAVDGESYVLEGHASPEGDDFYNMRLSRQRAVTIEDYLESKFGLGRLNIDVVAKGETEPVLREDEKPDLTKSRRVKVIRRYGG